MEGTHFLKRMCLKHNVLSKSVLEFDTYVFSRTLCLCFCVLEFILFVCFSGKVFFVFFRKSVPVFVFFRKSVLCVYSVFRNLCFQESMFLCFRVSRELCFCFSGNCVFCH